MILYNLSSSKKVLHLLEKAIIDMPSSAVKEGCKIIKDGFDSKLDNARHILKK